MSRPVVLTALVSIVVATAVGCGTESPRPEPLNVEIGAELSGDFSGSGPGTLISANVLHDIDIELRDWSSIAARITYTSTSGVDDSLVPVTAALFVPRGNPPKVGWPTVAFGHQVTGIKPECAPSLSRTLFQSASTIADLLRAGLAVTVPDYQGLGHEGVHHPFLDSRTVGFNLIDSVRAARKLFGQLSGRWFAVGVGQGGQAAWAANELSAEFGGGLQLIGSISVAPFADLEALPDVAAAGTLTIEQKLVLVQYLAALKQQRDDVNLDDYRRGTAQNQWDALLACQGSVARQRSTVASELTPDELRPASPEAVETLRGLLRATALPQRETSAPMWVSYDAADPVVPPEWTRRAIDRACALGDVIQFDALSTATGLDLPLVDEWIAARLRGGAPVNDCPGSSEEGAPDEEPTTDEVPLEESTDEVPTEESTDEAPLEESTSEEVVPEESTTEEIVPEDQITEEVVPEAPLPAEQTPPGPVALGPPPGPVA